MSNKEIENKETEVKKTTTRRRTTKKKVEPNEFNKILNNNIETLDKMQQKIFLNIKDEEVGKRFSFIKDKLKKEDYVNLLKQLLDIKKLEDTFINKMLEVEDNDLDFIVKRIN